MNSQIIFVSLTTSTLFFFSIYIFTYNKLKKALKDLMKLSIDTAVMQEYIDILQSKNSAPILDELIDKENFIKFLSDSRDWAYKYIEDVQFGIKEFIDSVEPDLSYFDKYGEVGSAYPHYDAMFRINSAYKKLKNLMPIEEEVKE